MIRYPGSKEKLTGKLMSWFPNQIMDPLFRQDWVDYREPFFGSGAIGFSLMERLHRDKTSVWINDKDLGITCLWQSVCSAHSELIELIDEFTPSVEAFYRFKEEDGRTDLDPVRLGFQKLALHMISFSGLGAKAGGPIGGRKQSSAFNVNCRWNPSRLKSEVVARHRLFKSFKGKIKITCKDFSRLTEGSTDKTFIYADPPYYEKGSALYKHSLSDDDHNRLAASLRQSKARWVLSYDDNPFIRNAYEWANIEKVELTYTIAISDSERRKNHEIVITPPTSINEFRGTRMASAK